MTLVASAAVPVRRDRLTHVVRVGLVVALLDLVYLVLVFVVALGATTPVRLFQGVARAVLSRAAFDMGLAGAALGVALHVVVSLAWTAAWASVYARSRGVREQVARPARALVAGVAYGLVIWGTMNFVVLPFTYAIPNGLASTPDVLVLLAHLTIIGPPIVFGLRDRDPH